jgi:hypothetical protein
MISHSVQEGCQVGYFDIGEQSDRPHGSVDSGEVTLHARTLSRESRWRMAMCAAFLEDRVPTCVAPARNHRQGGSEQEEAGGGRPRHQKVTVSPFVR